MTWSTVRRSLSVLGLAFLVAYAAAAGLSASPSLALPSAYAQTEGQVPGSARGNVSQAEIWRAVRKGIEGQVSIPDKKAGVLVQSEGDNLRAFRNGPMSVYGAWLLLAIVVLLALFFLLRGRIKIEAGLSGRTVERFNALERLTHWITASSFIVLALTGLNVLYGKYVLIPIIGQKAFAAITLWGKYAHNYIAFAFMIGIVIMFVLWVKDNIPNRHDLTWLAKGGGLFVKGTHPPAKRFNAGQKIIFWLVIIGGATLSFSGLCLLFPFEINPWSATFKFFNLFGFSLPTSLTALQETQLSLLWHGMAALVMIAVIIAHIYIGSLGMEGAIGAVGSGQVDENWAREHHSLWFAELKGEAPTHH